MVKQEKYLTPEVEEIELSIESAIAGSPTLIAITMTGDNLRDPITLTSDEYNSIFE